MSNLWNSVNLIQSYKITYSKSCINLQVDVWNANNIIILHTALAFESTVLKNYDFENVRNVVVPNLQDG